MTKNYADAKIRLAVSDRIDELMEKAEALDRPVKRPTVNYKLRGLTGGRMNSDGQLDINVVLLRENWDHYLTQTIGHEFAHHIQFKYFPSHRAHGAAWARVMVALGLPADRCHEYDTENAQVRKKNKFEYTCDGCGGTLILGPVRHKHQQAGYKMVKRGYGARVKVPYKLSHRCRSRTRTITFSKRLGQVTYKEARSAAAAPTPKPTVRQGTVSPRAQSWKQTALQVYARVDGERKAFITVTGRLGLKQSTASTYHHNIKSGKWG